MGKMQHEFCNLLTELSAYQVLTRLPDPIAQVKVTDIAEHITTNGIQSQTESA